jgi:GT2 family glycosyltransferase
MHTLRETGSKYLSILILDMMQKPKQTKPTLSIVIVTTDGYQVTVDCLHSIYQNPPQDPFEIILVDNQSSPPIQPSISKIFPDVINLTPPTRQGFAKNYNLGMRHAQGNFLLILNDDTLVQPQALDNLLHFIQSNETVGMVGAKMVDVSGFVQSPCARKFPTPLDYMMIQLFLDPGFPIGKLWDNHLRNKIEARKSGPVPSIMGACMLVRQRDLNKVGLLDEEYEFYFEDIEWCHRYQKSGFQVAYVSEATITHLGDHTMSKVREWAKQREYSGAVRYFKQYHSLSPWQHWALWLATTTGFLLRASGFAVAEAITRRKMYTATYFNLLKWIFTQKPNFGSM